MTRVLHLSTHLNIGGITSYIKLITKEMQNLDYRFYAGSSGGTQVPILEEQSVQCLKLNIKTKNEISPKVFLSIKPLCDFLKREKIDLIHAHTRVTQMLSWWVQRLTGIPYLSTCHGFYKRRVGRRLIPGWGNHVIAISKPVEGSLIHDFKVDPDKTTTIFNAINIPDLTGRYQQKKADEIREKLGIPSDYKVIGIVARIVEDKGHEYILRATKRLLTSEFPKTKIVIVGEGPFMAQTRRIVKKLEMDDAVIFLGNVQDVSYPLSIIDVFVLPAVWREGFGLSIIEAMAVSKPVIVTNIWALNELIQNRVNGLLVEPRDVTGLANAIRELFQNTSLRERIAFNGCEMVKREFSIPQMAARVDEVYQQVLQKGFTERSKTAKLPSVNNS